MKLSLGSRSFSFLVLVATIAIVGGMLGVYIEKHDLKWGSPLSFATACETSSTCNGYACVDLVCKESCMLSNDDCDTGGGYWCGQDHACHISCSNGTNATECPADSPVCDNNACYSGNCVGGWDCDGHACVGHTCSASCTADGDCYSSYWCGQDADCHNSCAEDNDCAPDNGYWCGQDTACHNSCTNGLNASECPASSTLCSGNMCLTGNCLSNTDCASGYSCENYSCNTACANDTDCDSASGYWCGRDSVCHNSCANSANASECSALTPVCDTNVCYVGNCLSASDCSGYACANHACNVSCSGNGDCDAGYWCGQDGGCHNTCTDGKNAAECSLSATVCDSNTCHMGNCRYASDCGGYICSSYVCYSACEDNADCDTGYWCGPDAECHNTCTTGKNAAECPVATPVCDNNACYAGNCASTSDCSNGFACNWMDHTCFTNCGTENIYCDQSSGYWCGGDTLCHNSCTPANEADNCLSAFGYWCGQDGACHATCSGAENCHSGSWCGLDSACHDSCAEHNDCEAGKVCDAGICYAGDCAIDNDCSNNYDCDVSTHTCAGSCSGVSNGCRENFWCGKDGACHNTCSVSNDCYEGTVCDVDTCIEGDCLVDADCNGYTCTSNTCETTCLTDSSCASGYWCGLDNACHAFCMEDNDCVSGYSCDNGTCSVVTESPHGAAAANATRKLFWEQLFPGAPAPAPAAPAAPAPQVSAPAVPAPVITIPLPGKGGGMTTITLPIPTTLKRIRARSAASSSGTASSVASRGRRSFSSSSVSPSVPALGTTWRELIKKDTILKTFIPGQRAAAGTHTREAPVQQTEGGLLQTILRSIKYIPK